MEENLKNHFIFKEQLDVINHIVKPTILTILGELALIAVLYDFDFVLDSLGFILGVTILFILGIWAHKRSELGQIILTPDEFIYGVGSHGNEVWRAKYDNMLTRFNKDGDILISTVGDNNAYLNITIKKETFPDFPVLKDFLWELDLFSSADKPQIFKYTSDFSWNGILFLIGYLAVINFVLPNQFPNWVITFFTLLGISGFARHAVDSRKQVDILIGVNDIKVSSKEGLTWDSALTDVIVAESALPDTTFLRRENRQLNISTPAGESITVYKSKFRDYDILVDFLKDSRRQHEKGKKFNAPPAETLIEQATATSLQESKQ